MKKFTRREIITAMGAGVLGVSTGCCRVAPRINHTSLTSTSTFKNCFTPLVNNSLPVIDAHAHFFNATDMQAGGYLAGPVANEWGIAGPLMNIVSKVIDRIAISIAPSTHKEWKYLDAVENGFKGLDSNNVLKRLDMQIDEHNKEIANLLYTELNKTDFPIEYKFLINKSGYKNKGSFEFNEETIYKAITNDLEDVTLQKAYKDRGFNFDPRKISAVFSFLGHMLSYRFHNIRKYHNAYTENTVSTKVLAAADAIVDFDYWVGDCDRAYSSMQDQIYLHERLANMTDNYIFPLAAYNPWTAIKDNYQYLDMVEEAIRYRGFKGVKIYPPIGYFPMGNSDAGVYPKKGRHPDLKKLDKALNALYEVCNDNNVPVMAHGNHSMGRNNQHKVMAGPEGWGKVFEGNNLHNLKVNIGHFGGDYKKGSDHSWAESFISLMKNNPNLYGDIGMWSELASGRGVPEFIKLLDQDIDENRKVYERVMFGTDWFMLSRDPDWKTYVESIFIKLKDSGTNDAVLQKLFSGNAEEFFRRV